MITATSTMDVVTLSGKLWIAFHGKSFSEAHAHEFFSTVSDGIGQEPSHVLLDLTDVEYLDLPFLLKFLTLSGMLRPTGHRLCFVSQVCLNRLLKTNGVDKLFGDAVKMTRLDALMAI